MTILTEKPTLYVVAKNCDLLKKHGESFQIRDLETNEIKNSAPAIGLRDILVLGNLNIDSEVFSLAEKYNIPFHFLAGNNKLRGSLIYDFNKNIYLRSKQFQYHFDVNKKFLIASKFVFFKISNQNVFLQKMRVSSRLNNDFSHIKNLEQLRGFEGSAARSYFNIWQNQNIIKNPQIEFFGRKKFPATDPLNSLLSFCYTLIHGEIHTQLIIAGLDPYIAYLHEQNYGHASLASDFIEIFRATIDHFVIRLINRKELDVNLDFEKESTGLVKLSKTGFQKFFPKWIEFIRREAIMGERNLTQIIERDIRKFVHYLNEDEDDFEPFDWSL